MFRLTPQLFLKGQYKMKYVIVSPYSGVLLEVDEDVNENRETKAIEPLIFRPMYGQPIAQGQPVPY